MMEAKELFTIKEAMQRLQKALASATGKQEQLMVQLKNDFNCSSRKAAESLLELYKNDLDDANKKIKELGQNLRESYTDLNEQLDG